MFSSYLGVQAWSLPEEGASNEPEAVIDTELVLHHIIFYHTGVGVVPLIRGESRHHEQGEGY